MAGLLEASAAVAEIIARAIRDGQSDGTFDARATVEGMMRAILIEASWPSTATRSLERWARPPTAGETRNLMKGAAPRGNPGSDARPTRSTSRASSTTRQATPSWYLELLASTSAH